MLEVLKLRETYQYRTTLQSKHQEDLKISSHSRKWILNIIQTCDLFGRFRSKIWTSLISSKDNRSNNTKTSKLHKILKAIRFTQNNSDVVKEMKSNSSYWSSRSSSRAQLMESIKVSIKICKTQTPFPPAELHSLNREIHSLHLMKGACEESWIG